jgi:hypothetical protein
MDKKMTTIGILTAILVLGGAYFVTKDSNTMSENPSVDTPQNTATESTSIETESLVFDEPTTENPGEQGNVRNQPAYLVQATTTHGKHYIGVDYVVVLTGEEAIQAQIEDGVCKQASECQSGQYIQNNNPHFRSYEISTTTPLTVEVSSILKTAMQSKGMSKSTLTFDELKDILPTLPLLHPNKEFPFKEARTFVYLDIIGGGVTKIREQ